MKWLGALKLSSVQFSRSVVSDSWWPHELQHTRPPCPSPTPGVHSNSRPSSQWCRPAISSSVIPFSSCPQSLPASESFAMSQLFAWGGQSTGVSIIPSKEHPGLISFRMDWLDLLAVQGTLQESGECSSLSKNPKICMCVFWFRVCAQLHSHVQLFASPWSVAVSQARILEWLVISFFRGSSWSRDRTWVSCIERWISTTAPPGN